MRKHVLDKSEKILKELYFSHFNIFLNGDAKQFSRLSQFFNGILYFQLIIIVDNKTNPPYII